MLTIRPANPADAPAIAQIHVDTWRAAYRGLMPDSVLDALDVERRAAFWKERLAHNRGVAFVAWEAERIIGFCDLIPTRDKDAHGNSVAEIASIYIAPAHWRKGAGRALCERALAEARRMGFEIVTLWVLASNTAAQKFYERLVFQKDGRTKTDRLADGTPLPEVRYRLTIGQQMK